jgi:uncharacterized glyoxalase superfamily protein PhnB
MKRNVRFSARSRQTKRSALTPSLYTPDIAAAVRYYTDKLGFTQTGSYEDEDGIEIWAEVARGEARIWFFSHVFEEMPEPVLSGVIYIMVDDVDAFARTLSDDVKCRWGPLTQDYGLREVGVEDCNGYILVFARDAKRQLR